MRLNFAFVLSLLSFVFAAPQLQFGKTTLVGRDVTLLKQEFFGGIPFAEPPLGSLRLEPPVLQNSLNASTFDASNFGLACIQPTLPIDLSSEDCLTINIFRPAGLASDASLPVMAWIYGGGFLMGDASMYNGSAIVAQSVARGTPVIYVNFNYRLGPLGFPQGQEADNRHSLNLGLKDQLTALQWIQNNIGTFGGDKAKVTVFGESAGAISIGILFLNSGLEKLARSAIFESGSAGSTPAFTAARRETDWQNFVAAVPGCAADVNTTHTFACIQAATSSQLLQAFDISTAAAGEEFPWSPTLDGPGGVLPDLPSRLLRSGQFARLPFIAGTNLDEGTLFTPQTTNSSEEISAGIIAGSTPSQGGAAALSAAAEKVLQLYPNIPALGSPINTGNETFGLSPQYKRAAQIFNDLTFQSQRRLWIQTASNLGVTTFGYLFSDPGAVLAPGLVAVPPAPGSLGVPHSSEIVFVYGGVVNGTAASEALSIHMTDYWISFATSLNPNDGRGTQRPNWTQFTPHDQVLIQLNGDNTTIIPDNYRAEQIAFANSQTVVFDR